MKTNTAKLLAEMSDDARFERLATGILREADPKYASLIHSGVNADGKTIKGPLDGITYVSGADPAHLIAVHHTTTKAANLESKWLHDPDTVKPRQGARPTAPAGDLVKTAKIVAEERLRIPTLNATLVLTTNQEPTVDLVRDVHNEAAKHGLAIDLWSRSRLAHFLDKPQGQWLRSLYLGVEPEHLSSELLTKLSHDSARNFRPEDDQSEVWVDRSLDVALEEARNDVVFVVAESGLGKSVACYKKLVRHIERGGYGLFLPHEILETAINLDQAVDLTLRQLHPHLIANSGADARALCETAHSLLIIVEDVNRSGKAPQLLEKLATWSERATNENKSADASSPCQVICPVWPDALLALKDQPRKRIDALSIACTSLTLAESRDAVQRRSALSGRVLSDVDADIVGQALGHDPLLIALHAPNKTPDPHRVLDDFIASSLARAAATHPEYTAPDYVACLMSLAEAMLKRRVLEPKWSDISAWFGISGATTNILRGLLKHGQIIRLAADAPNSPLRFRHDRVREAVLSSGLAAMMRAETVEASTLSDPFFAEIIGGALADPSVPERFIQLTADLNPLALFHALRRLGTSNPPTYSSVLKAVHTWIDQSNPFDHSRQQLRWQALAVLAQTDSPDVIALTKRFPDGGWSSWFARLRNGDLSGGIELCRAIEPGSNALWRDVQISHAKLKFGENLISKLAALLQRPDLESSARVGALRLAGHLADSGLSSSIASSWATDEHRADHLEDYLWAGAQCCGDNAEMLLGPVCDAWAALPSTREKDSSSPSPRDEMAAHNARFAFVKWPPTRALKYLIDRASKPELNWQILYLLHEIDNPDTLDFVAHELAKITRRLEGTDSFSPFASHATDRWDRNFHYNPTPMSTASKSRLLGLWTASGVDKHLRTQAFRLWAACEVEGDLKTLRRVEKEDELFGYVLFQRLRRGDQQAIPALIEKLEGDREDYWWQAGRYLWSDTLTEALDASLARRGTSAKREWDNPEHHTDWITSECLLRLPQDDAERLLIKHWDHLQFVPEFIQAALYTATPALKTRVETSMSNCPDVKKLMRHIDMHYNFGSRSKSGLTRIAQVESLIPYFNLFSDLAIDHFWHHCNKRGWFDFRRKHLDALVKYDGVKELLGGQNTDTALDRFSEKDRRIWVDRWLDDYSKAGATVDQIMSELASWFASRSTLNALKVASAVLMEIGRRRDLPILTIIPIEPRDEADSIIADTTFAVMRRTLH